MLHIEQVEEKFSTAINKETDSVKQVWEKFKELAVLPVEGEEEVEILFESGVYDFTGEDRFHYDFVRQISLNSGMYHLRCEFIFEYEKALDYLEVSEWSMDYETTAEFFTEVEKLEAFKKGLQLTSVSFHLFLEEV